MENCTIQAAISDGDSSYQTEYTIANNEKHKSALLFTLNEILVESAENTTRKMQQEIHINIFILGMAKFETHLSNYHN